jgi:hypothetical protein
MHRFWRLSPYILPALAIASVLGHFKGGASIAGFSSGF